VKTFLDEAGRIQLPEHVRSQLGVQPGDEVVLEPRAGEWVLKSAHPPLGLGWEGNVLVHKGTSRIGAPFEDLIEDVRNERFRQLTEGFAP
jgi:bifunctional DNA-binding transcriptional regulator/antitoxin component of YhaV-PrlF toxin-antitoxin module